MKPTALLYVSLACLSLTVPASAEVLYEEGFVFDPEVESHGHVHASCIVECPNGDLRVVWYENGPPLPEPYNSGDRDKRDDVRIGGGRRPAGASPMVVGRTSRVTGSTYTTTARPISRTRTSSAGCGSAPPVTKAG